MTYIEKRNKFLQDFKEKYPDYEIVQFSRIAGPIIFKDKDGFLYQKNNAFRVLSHGINIQAVIDKTAYVQHKLNELKMGLEVIDYSSMKGKIIVRDSNGFTYSPQSYDLLAGHKVSIETCNEKEALFIHKASIKHNNTYTYKDFKYINGKQEITITCSKHGDFMQKIESHLYGNGCPKCKADLATYDRKRWIENHKDKQCTFYILEFYNDNERFIKIGITSVNIKTRYSSQSDYKYNVIVEIKGDSKYVSDLEEQHLSNYSIFRHVPLLKFEGHTECFDLQIKNKIYEQFKS